MRKFFHQLKVRFVLWLFVRGKGKLARQYKSLTQSSEQLSLQLSFLVENFGIRALGVWDNLKREELQELMREYGGKPVIDVWREIYGRKNE